MLKQYFKFLTLPHDKLSHFFYGVTTSLCMLPFFSHYFIMCTLLVISVAKEIWDTYNNGGIEYLDLLATVSGGAAIILARSL